MTHASSIASSPGEEESSSRDPLVRGRRVAQWFLGLCVVVALGVIVLSRISANEYAITPGGAQNVAPLISINGTSGSTSVHSGSLLLTDVSLSPVTWLNYLWFKATADAEFVPAKALVPAGVPVSQLDAQGFLEMAQSKDAAKVAALERLGYSVGATPDGALITAVGAKAPAEGSLSVADVVDEVNGKQISNSCGLIAAVHALAPGTRVELGVRKATIKRDGAIARGDSTPVAVTLGKAAHPSASNCPGVRGVSTSFLGVGLEDDVAYRFPMDISISTPNIGGPSAGLAMTLGIIDRLSGGHLVGNRKLAATGTMDPFGRVGDVGGVPQKTVAVSRAGAHIFLVPHEELGAAQKKAPAALKVTAVSTLDEAINRLEALGGTLTMANGTVESRTSKGLAP